MFNFKSIPLLGGAPVNWLSRTRREPGWLAVSLSQTAIGYAHARRTGEGAWCVSLCGSRAVGPQGLEQVGRALNFGRFQCTTMLDPGEYQMLLVEAPNVPLTEMKAAVRWKVKDMIDFHLDDATIDVLDIPEDPSGANRAHSIYAIAVKNEVVQACIKRFEDAHLPLAVIDIVETAQRNLGSLYETEERGVAMLYFAEEYGLLTITRGGELYLSRRLEIGARQIFGADGEQRDELFNRIVLELQRTLDHFDRQFRYVSIAKLMLGPERAESGIEAFLRSNLDLPVEVVRLPEVLRFEAGTELDREGEWRMFHLLGATLRTESKVP